MTVSTTLRDLDRLKQLYTAGFQDTFLDSALRKIIDSQIARDEADLRRVNEALEQFECQHGLSSDEFWRRFQSGQMADTADFMEWNAFCKMKQRIIARLRILHGNGDYE
jgi:hypothetical protein